MNVLPNGIVQKKGANGMFSTVSGYGKNGSGIGASVRNVAVFSDRLIQSGPNSVTSIVRWQRSGDGVAGLLAYDLTGERRRRYRANEILLSSRLRAVAGGSWMGS